MFRTAPMAGVLLLLVVASLSRPAAGSSYAGREFPDFTAADAFTGQRFSLSDLRGKVVLVDFWATWCGPCVAELPNVKRAYQRYRNRGFEIVSISLDTDRNRFQSFVRSRGMNWRHVMEGGGWRTRLAKKYGINSIPRMIVIGPDGVCVADNARGRTLERAIESALPAQPPSGTPGADEEPQPKQKPKRRAEPKREPRRPPRREKQPPQLSEELRVSVEGLSLSREALDELGRPLERFKALLAGLENEAADLEAGLLEGQDSAAVRQRVAGLCEQLADARHRMFMLGLIDAQADVRVPANPLDTVPAAGSAGVLRALPMLAVARRAIGEMEQAVDRVAQRLATLEAEMDALGRRLAQGDARPGWQQRVDSVQARANDLAEGLSDPWLHQMEVVEGLIAQHAAPLEGAAGALDAIGARLDELRAAIKPPPRDTPALRALRDAFGGICRDLEQAAAQIDEGYDRPPLPVNPFEGRRLRDRRVLAALEAEIDVAAAAASSLRAALAGDRGRFRHLADEFAALRETIDARLETGGELRELRERFSELARRVLALGDPAAEA